MAAVFYRFLMDYRYQFFTDIFKKLSRLGETNENNTRDAK